MCVRRCCTGPLPSLRTSVLRLWHSVLSIKGMLFPAVRGCLRASLADQSTAVFAPAASRHNTCWPGLLTAHALRTRGSCCTRLGVVGVFACNKPHKTCDHALCSAVHLLCTVLLAQALNLSLIDHSQYQFVPGMHRPHMCYHARGWHRVVVVFLGGAPLKGRRPYGLVCPSVSPSVSHSLVPL